MIKYKQVYCDYFGYDVNSFIECELCQKSAHEIHHLTVKGMGGRKNSDVIENLIAVCRTCHNKCHDHPEFNEEAREIHLKNL